MDKEYILERINEYNGQNVHVWTHLGKAFTGQLNIITVTEPNIHRVLEIGWRQNRIEVQSVAEIHPT